ncbi:MAG: hypothetical protein ACM3O9_01910 [Methylocystaceae bacterium]
MTASGDADYDLYYIIITGLMTGWVAAQKVNEPGSGADSQVVWQLSEVEIMICP